MSKMMAPKMEVIRFNEADIIVASGGYTMMWSNFNNKNVSDNNITFDDGSTYSFGNNSADDVLAMIYNKTGANANTKIWNQYRMGDPNKEYAELSKVVGNLIKNNDFSEGSWNYSYSYDAANNRFNKH